MIVQQLFVNGISHSSYLLGGTKTCAIIDPQRDIQAYLDAAADLEMKITHILETHLHADFVSGHLDLAKHTSAKIYTPGSGYGGNYGMASNGKMVALRGGDRYWNSHSERETLL